MLLVNNYNPYLMNTAILIYYKYLASSIQHAWNVTCKQLQPIPDEYRNLELLYIYLACSFQHAWNVTCKPLHPIPDEYRNLELL